MEQNSTTWVYAFGMFVSLLVSTTNGAWKKSCTTQGQCSTKKQTIETVAILWNVLINIAVPVAVEFPRLPYTRPGEYIGLTTSAITSHKIASSYIAAGLRIDVLGKVLNYDTATATFENGVCAEFFESKFHSLLLHAALLLHAVCDEEQKRLVRTGSPFSRLRAEAFSRVWTLPETLHRKSLIAQSSRRMQRREHLICGSRAFPLMASDKRSCECGQRPGCIKVEA
ncbi:hypothetical protein SELMODRAFT_403743 [Selaginella moellendorffii]|uniref:Uncharacterized protein n=1 Tax=Selaginella moellendorffii TaxID=88036 RepID=D8QSD9_SELML|nr:hypothetical protein SELMODRAFT_403743 [Selaginella moellendorffii]